MWKLVAEDGYAGCYADAVAGGEGSANGQTVGEVVHGVSQNDHDDQGHVT